MLVLLDENLPHRLRTLLRDHDVRTVAYQGWKALSNGQLLKAARDAGFAVMVTADQSMRYQQNLDLGALAVIVLSSNEAVAIQARVAEIREAIDSAEAGAFVDVDLSEGTLD
ncbi:MAG: DUF5615 family PIN-like protein [Candidatus Eremiobacteraeota bacterium]|nr:DUF5615 family PIN-like protein [Candidatus Eremiobacteraeota bacterium]